MIEMFAGYGWVADWFMNEDRDERVPRLWILYVGATSYTRIRLPGLRNSYE